MKKIGLAIGIIVIFLFILDQTIFKDKGPNHVSKQSSTYPKVEDQASVPIGLDEDEKAPSFTIQTIDGKEVSLEQFRGKKILLNFWATWCPPCKKEMPEMQKFYEEYESKDYLVLAVNVTVAEKTSKAVSSFVDDYGLTFPVLMDEKGEVAHQFEILSYPTSYFIDSDGIIRKKIVGGLSKEMLYREMSLLP
ncbi:TlpA disulfide reductase family protein [Robertmurraya andreesenii]|uniref:Peroxiredoxin n=1 Tax=Anoxybacillus andreesenii TaxID=1325932 RepID=A0ABT9V281_9BACL|nr:TlpA disulfide reductase family protein [Robertmurraya andreesenii]MDQ0155063.1 peroxiredoxin [Robertmurraya andreesenii]